MRIRRMLDQVWIEIVENWKWLMVKRLPRMNFVIDDNPYSFRMLVADIEVPTVLGYDFLRDNS